MFISKMLKRIPSTVDFKAEGASCEKLLSASVENGFSIMSPKKNGYVMYGTVFARDYKKLRNPARKLGLHIKAVKKYGIYFSTKKHIDKIGMVIGAVFAATVIMFLNLFIWEINVSGNKSISKENILDSAYAAGLKVGTLRKNHDSQEIEWNILRDNGKLAWVSVNIQGCCANIVVNEAKEEAEMKYDDDKPVNIIASKYGVIKKIDVFDGQGVVKVGDAVMKGDLLVSAAFEDSHGKLTLKHSRATVLAETDYEISVEFPLKQVIENARDVKKTIKEIEILGLSIPLGNKNKYTALPAQCVERQLRFLWIELPVTEKLTKYFDVKQNTITYTLEQAKDGAWQLLEEKELDEMKEMEIISRKVEEKIENGKYIIFATYDCIMNIAMEQDILSDIPWENTDNIS